MNGGIVVIDMLLGVVVVLGNVFVLFDLGV